MVGHLIPANDKVWSFVRNLVKIIDYLLLPKFNHQLIQELRDLIEEHNIQYVELFRDTLKPKHHLLLHYPTIIEYSGPPKFYWSFRFEAKHQELKTYAKVINSRRNILLSLATKFQLKFAFKLFGKSEKLLNIEKIHKLNSSYSKYLAEKLETQETEIECFSKIVYNGVSYKKDLYVTQTIEELLKAYKIAEVCIFAGKTIYLICVELSITYSDHYLSYEILNTKNENFSMFPVTSIDGPPVNSQILANGKEMIRPKVFFN